MPHAATLIRTSPGPGSGRGKSASSNCRYSFRSNDFIKFPPAAQITSRFAQTPILQPGGGTLLRWCFRLLHSKGREVSRGVLVRKRPELVAVEEELTSENQQPDPEREAQGPAWDVRAEERSTDRPHDASADELQQERRVGRWREPVRAAADQRRNKAE